MGYESRFKETVMVKMDVETFIVEHRGQNVSLEKLDNCLFY